MPARKGYSALQIGLHWAVAGLVLIQFLVADAIEEAWDAMHGEAAAAEPANGLAYAHILFGWAIFVLVAWRIWLRLTRGAPKPPANEPAVLKMAAHATHGLLYLLLLGLPLSGSAAWFLGVEPAAEVHVVGKTVLLILVGLHIAGALYQRFVLRSDVMSRMLSAENS